MLAALGLISSLSSTETPLRPHILLVLADDFGFANLGVNRRANNASPQALAESMTPNLDALAHDGILLNHHMASFMSKHAHTVIFSSVPSGENRRIKFADHLVHRCYLVVWRCM